MKTKSHRALFRDDIRVHVAVLACFHARSTFEGICVHAHVYDDLQQARGSRLRRGVKMAPGSRHGKPGRHATVMQLDMMGLCYGTVHTRHVRNKLPDEEESPLKHIESNVRDGKRPVTAASASDSDSAEVQEPQNW